MNAHAPTTLILQWPKFCSFCLITISPYTSQFILFLNSFQSKLQTPVLLRARLAFKSPVSAYGSLFGFEGRRCLGLLTIFFLLNRGTGDRAHDLMRAKHALYH